MKLKQVLLLSLMTLGLLFSAILRVRFHFDQGFHFDHFWIRFLPLPVWDFCGEMSNEKLLTSTFVGYLFFFLFGVLMIKEMRLSRIGLLLVIGFLMLCNYAMLFELRSIFAGIKLEYTGQHFRIGPTLFVIAWILFSRNRKYVEHGKVDY